MSTPNTTVRVNVAVNGAPTEHDVEARTLLVQYLREVVGLTGTNIGCDSTSCGACTVLLDGESVKSCTVLAAQADGRAVTTIEGLADGDTLHPMQAAFREHHGLQCGYCTPGMVMAAVSLGRRRVATLGRSRGAQGPRRQPLPLHRLPQHRRRGARRLGASMAGRPVIPAAFAYARADSLDEAIALLAEHGDEAKLLAGGHSLLPLMKLRLATPSVLVDVGRLARPLLRRATPATRIAIGGLTRHHDVEHDRAACASSVPLLARGGRRGRRPAGASPRHPRRLARARRPGVRPPRGRPRARAARSSYAGSGGERAIAADDFFEGFLETALAPDEIITEVRRAQDQRRRLGVREVQPAGAGLGDRRRRRGRRRRRPASRSSTWAPRRCAPSAVEAALRDGASPADAAAAAGDGTEPPSDLNASPEYRRHLARVLVGRAARDRRRRRRRLPMTATTFGAGSLVGVPGSPGRGPDAPPRRRHLHRQPRRPRHAAPRVRAVADRARRDPQHRRQRRACHARRRRGLHRRRPRLPRAHPDDATAPRRDSPRIRARHRAASWATRSRWSSPRPRRRRSTPPKP